MEVEDQTLEGTISATEMEFGDAFEDSGELPKEGENAKDQKPSGQETQETGQQENESGFNEEDGKPPEGTKPPEDEKLPPDPKDQELERLRAEIETLKAGTVQTKEEKPPEKQEPVEFDIAALPDDLKGYVEDYPEALTLAEKVAEHRIKQMFGGGDPKEFITSVNQELGQVRFEAAVMRGGLDKDGNWVDGHPDLYKIVVGPHKDEYARYCQEEKIDPNTVTDPIDAIKILAGFKEKVLSPAIAASKEKREAVSKRGAELMAEAGASLGQARGSRGNSTAGSGTKGDQLEDFEGAFSEA
ncbi:MAG: hypothetical protein AAGU11_09110 [Syntrophobacteraceae bacterium]